MSHTRTAGLVSGAVVAAVAGAASYTHMRALAAEHGEQWLSYITPLSVDGLLVVASLVIVEARRRGDRGPVLAWLALVAGVLASLAANVAAAGPDLTSKVIAAWPPAAFTIAFELVLRLVRVTTQPDTIAAQVPENQTSGEPGEGDLVDRAARFVAAREADGVDVGRGTLAKEFGLTEHQARQLLAKVRQRLEPTLHAVGGER
ncbi:hypothetical protein BAY59_24190 [Prauserella coralliicola]|nr:hypothetical protein BAY59_24190 [Prauserella coralliicola]